MIRRQSSLSAASLVAVAALGAISFAGCQKGAEEPKPGPQGSTPPVAQTTPTTLAAADRPALCEAALKRDPGKVKQLLAGGAKVDEADNLSKTALIYAAGDNDRAAGGGFGGRGGGQASWADRDGVVAMLLSHHADPNATARDGTTALLAALVHHQSVSGPFDLDGTRNARINKVRLLLAAGAKVDRHTAAETEDHLHAGSTPLMAAAINGTAVPIKLLIAKGADVNAKDQDGNTALITAAKLGNFDAVQLLIANHADVNASNAKGGTALSAATRMKSTALARCADMLRSAGAK